MSRSASLSCEQLRTVGLSSSAPENLALLVLGTSENGQATENGTRFRFMLTHEQIGEFILRTVAHGWPLFLGARKSRPPCAGYERERPGYRERDALPLYVDS